MNVLGPPHIFVPKRVIPFIQDVLLELVDDTLIQKQRS
jgi:hypothetical protein